MRTDIAKIELEDLCQDIINIFRQWPDLERRIFYQTHYFGQSLETISRSFKLDVEEVDMILEKCDLLLHTSLRKFRKTSCEKPTLILTKKAGLDVCG